LILIAMFVPRIAVSTPVPDIRANNSDALLELNTRDALSITVSLSPGAGSGMSADWWIAATTPFGWYGYVHPNAWQYAPRPDDLMPAHQGVLFELAPVMLLEVTGLPAGNYIFYLAVDTVMNGQLDFDHLFYDSVMVSISEPTGNTYYVATNGSDSNSGTLDAPWLTIQYAADTMRAGDTVYIRGGVYCENVTTAQSGSSSGNIVFSNYPGETPVIDGTGVDANNGFIIDQNYIKLSGVEVRNWNHNVIWVENAAYFEISDCVVHDAASGIGIAYGSHDFVLNRVVAHHFDLYGFDVSTSGGADCYNGTFNDCTAHTGRDREQNVDGFALGHGTQHDFVFNRCITHDVYDGFDISARDTTLNRCSAYDCWNGGYKLWQDNIRLVNCIGMSSAGSNVELDWDEQPGITTLTNCTFYNAGSFNVWVENSGDSLHMCNCILAGGDNIGLAFEQMGVTNYQGDYNLFHNDNPNRAVVVGYSDEFSLAQLASGEWTAYSGQDAHSIVVYSDADIFVDPPVFDLHLSPASPAIDSGTGAGAPSEDFDGRGRPQGNGYDIGAYER
jgi:hypothetical protein